MKYLALIVGFIFSSYSNAQNLCIDSSSYIRYQTQLNDSIRLEKTILSKDSSKISVGYFLNGSVAHSGKSFIYRTNKNGDIDWFKRITSPFINSTTEIESLEEAENGNIFITIINGQLGNNPFSYCVFSPNGNLIAQNEFGIANNSYSISNSRKVSLVTRFGVDSMLFILIHPVNAVTTDGMTLLTVSNNGQIGQGIIYAPPIVTTNNAYYSKCRIVGNTIFLYGGAQFNNTCKINSFEQPGYATLTIDWNTKQVISQKFFCSPSVGTDQLGNPLSEGVDNYNTNIFPQANGDIIFSRRIWGLDFNGGDTLTRVFKISTFDSAFNHIRSEYICIRKRFKWWIDWSYGLNIDSFGTRHLYAHDLPNKLLYYSVGNSASSFYFQKQLPYLSPRKNGEFETSKLLLLEPGFFTSFQVVSSDHQKAFIDNFRIIDRDTSANCFGSHFDLLVTKQANVSTIYWPGNFTNQQAVISSAVSNFTIEDYQLQKNIICNIVNRCDTIKINAPDTVCNFSQPVIITAYKNPLCNGKVKFLFDTAAVQSYTQINDTTLSLTFNKGYIGKIFAQPSSCDKLKDSVQIIVSAPPLPINLGRDTLFCPGKNYLLQAYNPFFKTYLWQDGSTDSVFLATSEGTFFVTATDYCNNIYTDTIRIKKKDFKIDLGKDDAICRNEEIILSVPAGFISYSWKPDYRITNITPYKVSVKPDINTAYIVGAEVFSGCTLHDTINLKVEICPEYIYFPNSFTPNNDGLNETFKPLVSGALEKYELTLYNRWGQLVFKTTNKNSGWEGKIKGISQDVGVYVWKCLYKFYNKPEKLSKGTVAIIR